MKTASCHPDRKHYAKGLCIECYRRQFWDAKIAMRPVQPMRGRTPALLTITLPSTEAEIGYLAGILDGEGCLQHGRRHGGGHGSWGIQIANSNKEIIDWLVKIGGGVTIRDPAPHWRFAKKRLYMWHLSGAANVQEFLQAVFPLLKEKRAKAETALKDISDYLQRHQAICETGYQPQKLSAKRAKTTKTHCSHGHALIGDNAELYRDYSGKQRVRCRACRRATCNASKRRRQLAEVAASAPR